MICTNYKYDHKILSTKKKKKKFVANNENLGDVTCKC